MTLKLEISNLYKKEKSRLLSFIRNRIENREDAEDILQDVFYSTLEGISVTDKIDNLLAWLYTAARNRIIDWYRKKRLTTYPLEDIEKYGIDEMIADSGLQPEQEYEKNLIIETIAENLEVLPAEQRRVFILQELEGMTFKEIAEITGEPVNTLISRKRYAVQFLRKQLHELISMPDKKP